MVHIYSVLIYMLSCAVCKHRIDLCPMTFGRLIMAFKAEEKEWLKAAGVWEQCWQRKDEYKAAGDKPSVARRKALDEFYRPDDDVTPAVAPAQAATEATSP